MDVHRTKLKNRGAAATMKNQATGDLLAELAVAPATTAAGLPAVLDAAEMEALGVTADDLPAIRALADTISAGSPMSVAEFGRDVANHTSGYADSLLDQVKTADLDEAGKKLTEVLNVARSMNLKGLSNQRSRLPVIGPLLDRFRLSTKKFIGQFESSKEQIDALIGEVEITQNGLGQRIDSLESMFTGVKDEWHLLGQHIAAGRWRLAELREQAAAMRGQSQSAEKVQEMADLQSLITNLDKRLGDLQALQHSALQSLPTIRMIQSNNQLLVDKFHTIRQITVPAWKRQFMLSLSLNEQRNAVQLAQSIDDTTNDLLRRNAALLHTNSVQTAKANQRLVIDVDTLRDVQKQLIQTVEDVLEVQRAGVEQRRSAAKEIESMRRDLQVRLERSGAVQAEAA